MNDKKLKVIPYKDLITVLPPGNKLEALYEKAKDKSRFEETFYPVYDGDIDTDTLNLHNDIYWDTFYKFVHTQENLILAQPIILGNVHCKVLSFFEGLITGNVQTLNMWTRHSDHKDGLAQITGNLNVEEVFLIDGKGLKKNICLAVNGAANIHTLISSSGGEVKANKLSIQKEFSFPFIYATGDKGKYAQKKFDWSLHTLEELTTYFNKELLNMEYVNDSPDMFFKAGTILSKDYQNYLA